MPPNEDVIRMAREAGMEPEALMDEYLPYLDEWVDHMKRFAAIVIAAERNKLAQWMVFKGYATGHGDTIEDLLKELEWQVAERERKACIKDCDSVDLVGADDCIDAIRARGQA